MIVAPGERLLELCRSGRSRLLLVAPFMKADVVSRLLDTAPVGGDVKCVTRWRPAEVASGVSDLAVLDVVTTHGGRLLLRNDLHAKYYRAEDRCLVGSANLTATALGWAPAPNLELLVNLPADIPELHTFETTLLAGTVPATQSIADLVAAAAALLTPEPLPDQTEWEDTAPTQVVETGPSLPLLRDPQQLFDVYRGHSQLTTSAGRGAQGDLAALAIPPGLRTCDQFNAVVAAALLQLPLVAAVDEFLSQSRRFGEVVDFLADRQPDRTRTELDRQWQTLIRWLRHFMPNRYAYFRRPYSEILQRRRD